MRNEKMPRTYVKDLRRGETVGDIFLVEGANFKQTRNGKFFIQMTLRDFSGAVKGLRWEATRDEFRRIEQNPFLRVQGRVEEFQGSPQIIIDEHEPLSAEDAQVNPAEFLPRTRYSIEDMEAELDRTIESIEDVDVRRILVAVMARPGVREGVRSAPAGKVMHHATIGGLLEHIVSLLRLSERVLEHYPHLDRSMLLAGVILHDLGKIDELTYQTGFGYSQEGQLVGHIVMGVTWIDEVARSLGDVDPEKTLELKHLVASHHGKLEFGSPKMPMTAEAMALHFLDNLDAKLSAYQQCYEDLDLGPHDERWSDFNPMMGTRLYFPRRLDSQRSRPQQGTPGKPRQRDESGDAGELPFS